MKFSDILSARMYVSFLPEIKVSPLSPSWNKKTETFERELLLALSNTSYFHDISSRHIVY